MQKQWRWNCRCGSRGSGHKIGGVGEEAVDMEVENCGSRIVETVMHVWEQKQKRWRRRCKIRNSRDGSQEQ